MGSVYHCFDQFAPNGPRRYHLVLGEQGLLWALMRATESR